MTRALKPAHPAPPDEFMAKPAVRGETPCWLGLVGPSGAGKTFSALRLATGMAEVTGGAVHVLDTESGRARHYASEFRFRHVDFRPPFSSLRYLAAIEAQVTQGARVVVIDSASHEHEGQGGYLETHAQELDRLGGEQRHTFSAWRKPAEDRRRMINQLLQLPVHLIWCFRAKEKIKVNQGKQQPTDLGWMPIAGDELVYEMLVRGLLLPGSDGVPTWQPERVGEREVPKLPAQFRGLFGRGQQLTEAHGAAVARWAAGGEVAANAARPTDPPAAAAAETSPAEPVLLPPPPTDSADPKAVRAWFGQLQRMIDQAPSLGSAEMWWRLNEAQARTASGLASDWLAQRLRERAAAAAEPADQADATAAAEAAHG